MNVAWVETAIIIIILLGFGAVLWKGGAANPVGTGALQTRVTAIGQKIETLKSDMARATEKMSTLEGSCASSVEIGQLRDMVQADRRRTEQVFLKIESVESDIAELRLHQTRRDVVIEALSESVRNLAADLRSHQMEIADKLEQLDAMSARIDASNRAIEALASAVPTLRDRQAAIAEAQATTAADVRHVRAQVDRLYDFLTEKALK
jgi:chromosome segregation ATPase